ncbi:hypothetical protein EOM09_09250 [bacterium]|nr:hypothetical protein [bacterium]
MKIYKEFLLESEISEKYPEGLRYNQFINFKTYMLNILKSYLKINVAIDIWDDIEESDSLHFIIKVGERHTFEFDYDLNSMEAKKFEINMPSDIKNNDKSAKVICKIGTLLFDNESFWFNFKNAILKFFDLDETSIHKSDYIDAEFE